MRKPPKWVSYAGVVLIALGMVWAIWVMGSYVVDMILKAVH